MLARKTLVIILLLGAIGGYFYIKPLLYKKSPTPYLIDRMPNGDFIGFVNLLDLARETNGFMYHHKLPFRDFLTAEFILAQGKNYGLDVQKKIAFFVNENDEWGSLIHVKDSSKIRAGINRINTEIGEITDTLVGGYKIKYWKKQNIYFSYGKDWFFTYHGYHTLRKLYHVMFSARGDANVHWKRAKDLSRKTSGTLFVYSNWKKLTLNGIEYAYTSFHSDSTHFNLKASFKSKEQFDVSLKDSGNSIKTNSNVDLGLEAHINVNKIRSNPFNPIKRILTQFTKRINFPIEAFFNAWEGDISFMQGGKQIVKEKYIETTYDDDFNPIEITKTQDRIVPGYTAYLSMNPKQKDFISNLFAKGIMRKENNRFYILTSPPLKIIQNNQHLMLFSSEFAPKIKQSNKQMLFWKVKNDRYQFKIDSVNQEMMYISASLPGMNLIKQTKLF